MKQNNILKRKIIDICRTLYEKDMVSSTGGNVSVRNNNQIFITQSGKSLGRLTLQMIVRTNLKEEVLEGEKPSKEISMHCAIYKVRKDVNAIVHTHSVYSTALSCIAIPCYENVLPIMTPGYVIRVGALPLLRYFRPGSLALAKAVADLSVKHKVILLQNHGLIVCGIDLEEAINITEEVEENAKIYFLTGRKGRSLNKDEVEEILKVKRCQNIR